MCLKFSVLALHSLWCLNPNLWSRGSSFCLSSHHPTDIWVVSILCCDEATIHLSACSKQLCLPCTNLAPTNINYPLPRGFPGGSSGEEPACRRNRCKRHRFHPCVRKEENGNSLHPQEEEMAIHSSILAWRIPWTEEPGGLPSVGSQRVRQDWNDLARTYTHQALTTCQIPSWALFMSVGWILTVTRWVWWVFLPLYGWESSGPTK